MLHWNLLLFQESITKMPVRNVLRGIWWLWKGFIFLTRPVAAVTGVGIVSNTALVVKYGWSEFTVSPVVHGVPLIWNEQTVDVAVGYMAKHLQELVLKDNPDLDQTHFPLKYAEDILARLGEWPSDDFCPSPVKPAWYIFQGYSNDILEERNQKQNESILDLDVDGTKGTINNYVMITFY